MGKFSRTTTLARVAAQSLYYGALVLRDGVHLSPARLVEEHARKRPHHSALLFEDRHYSYRSFNSAANRVSSTFASMGAREGDVVALLMDNRPEYLFSIIGCNKLGVVTSLINSQISGSALLHAINACRPRWIVVGEEHLAALTEILDRLPLDLHHVLVWSERRNPALPEGTRDFNRLVRTASDDNPRSTKEARTEDVMLHMYTSGTTGLPKAARMTNQRFLRGSYALGQAVLRLSPRDVMYIPLPLYHATGAVTGWGSALVAGACVALRRRFSASEFWEDCHRYGATTFPYIGELCRYLLQSPPHPLEAAHRVRVIAGAGLRRDVWVPFQKRFAIGRIVEFYGSTEGNVVLVNLTGEPGMLGQLLPGHRVVRVRPDTEEFVRDDNEHLVPARIGERGMLIGRIDRIQKFDGYLEAHQTRGKILLDPFGQGHEYFSTGDLVELHEDNFVSFVDRLGDTFRWKGENVATTEVSMTLNEAPGVVESNVYGVKVAGHEGRAGMAALVVDDSFELDAFSKHVTQHLARYARPCFIRLSEAMKLTASFKYVKTEAQAQGYDPALVQDPLFVLDPSEGRYVPLTQERFRLIQAAQPLV